MKLNVRHVSLVVVVSALTVFGLVGNAGPPGPIGLPCGNGCDSALFIKRVYPFDPLIPNNPTPELYGVININAQPCVRTWTVSPPNSDDPSGNVVVRSCHQLTNDLVAGHCPDGVPGDQPVSVQNPASMIGGLTINVNCYEDPENAGEPGDCVPQP